MAKYQEFVSSNRPQSVEVSTDELIAEAERLGYRSERSEGFLTVRSEEGNVKFHASGMAFHYFTVKVNASELTYMPRLSGVYGSFGELRNRLEESLAGRLARPVVVTLPEKVVVLPLPPWANAHCENGGNCQSWVKSPEIFESEARPLIEKFMAELNTVSKGGG